MDEPAESASCDVFRVSGMENDAEEQLRSTLHCDDKEKLRRKLALLQREYLRTAQRLQRAERSDARRRHVRSRITQQNHRDPEVTSSPSPLTLSAAAHGPADPDNLRRSQVIRFLLPSPDDACSQTPDPSPDAAADAAAGGHRPSPALSLRSRRSRLRWERRSAEAPATEGGEDGPEQSGSNGAENGGTEGGDEDTTKREEAEVVKESEGPFSTSESESPSLLLAHWRTQTLAETGDVEGDEARGGGDEQGGKEEESTAEGTKEPESTSCGLGLPTNGKRKTVEEGDGGEESGGQRETTLAEENSYNKDVEQNATETKGNEKSSDDTVEIKEETTEGDGKSAGLLDSCTLVEGLLFPAEYYVRTTRRMTSSQSQPDMQAVILSQLSAGRQRRSRGRGRGRGRGGSIGRSLAGECGARADFSSLTPASAELPADSQSPGEIADKISAEAFSSPAAGGATPRGRGRRRKRGRWGRGRARTPRAARRTSQDPRPAAVASAASSSSSSSPSSPPSPRGPDGPKPRPVSPCGVRPSPGVDGARCSPASAHLQTVYPIFLKSSGGTKTSTQTSSGASCWRSLLLPSPPPSAQTSSLLPLPSLSPGSLLDSLMTSDLHLDFHLPDEQFASLKLHKLRRVAAESLGVERFASPSYNTRNSSSRSRPRPRPRYGTVGDPETPLPLPLSLTPTIAAVDVHNESLAGETLNRGDTEAPGGQRAENLDATTDAGSTESASVARGRDADSLDQTEDAVNPRSQRCVSAGEADQRVEPRPRVNSADEIKRPASDGGADVVCSSEDQTSTNRPPEDEAVVKTLSFDCPPQEATEEPSDRRAASRARGDVAAPGDSPAKASEESSSEPAAARPAGDDRNHGVRSQFLLSPPLASAPGPFTTPQPPPSAPHSSPTLPLLGLTPRPGSAGLPSASPPFAPPPPPHGPATQALSPPTPSPRPSVTSPPLVSPSCQNRASSDPYPDAVARPAAPGVRSRDTAGQEGRKTEAAAERDVIRCTHTLKAPAGGCLVDACCLPGPSGGVWVAAAGKWAVCLWSGTPALDWSLSHTWTFSDPVINVFPVPDAAGLLFVTLGRLEIREVRTLSCSSLAQVPLCVGVVQAAVGVSRSRVVTSSHSATASTLRLFRVSGDGNGSSSSRPLVSPGVCVGALAPVDGLPDALIGTDEGGRVFVWNLKSGQLLRTVVLCDGLSHTSCLRGYSYCGVLFVLLQHQLLSSLEEEEKAEEDRKRSALFSLVAVNPLSGSSTLATRLYPPTAWTGRLCEADVSSSGVVGLSQSGRACVWELGRPAAAAAMVRCPDAEGWQLARWGGVDTLLTGRHNGDVALHRYSNNNKKNKT